ncbi:cyclic peptide export ABC transporter [Hazenella coriacea]|uniref:Cyclic peptide transporter n=1 Tax=Hazenella coriacea TaxID=1179467 RepID=A0A4R3LBA9_9BACL|nr:cyclic peptide export ABC transporter [Hazenella coriacea]TCS97012.1 cyclic peptide transporter [Hazenella coriacea]
MIRVKNILLILMVILQLQLIPTGVEASSNTKGLPSNYEEQVEALIHKQMADGKIPGLSVVIVKGDQAIYKKGFGYSDLESKKPMTNQTLFEIGSNSKAFTAVAVYDLVEKGFIQLNDPVHKYLPWFQMKYIGEYRGQKVNGPVDITIEQLLHHTSGIPFNSIGKIPAATDDGALEKTVRALLNQELASYPGEEFSYATINYDILGLVIQKVSNQSFESYMEEHILKPLQLQHTYLFRSEAAQHDLSKGYKIGFLRPMEFDAPMYRGNTPAGYFISNAEDMEKWLQIQLGTYTLKDAEQKSIENTHVPNRLVAPSPDGSSYAGGWQVYQKGTGELSHEGSNPNFSSFIAFRPQEELGVAVMANLNSTHTTTIGQGIIDLMQGDPLAENTGDMYKSIDAASFTVILLLIPFICITLYFIILTLVQIIKKKRRLEKNPAKYISVSLASLAFLLVLGYCLYKVPSVFFDGLSWDFVNVWAPISLIIAVGTVFLAAVLFCFYLSLVFMFPHHKGRDLFLLISLSITSGFGNAFIIFIINEALNRTGQSGESLFLYFALGIIIYVVAQKLVRTKLITLTNNLIYEIRIDLLDKILHSPYEKVEQMETGVVQTTLNNDTEAISNHAASLITGLTDSITLLCCLVYLGIINVYGLLVSIVVILVAAGLYYVVGNSADKLWEQTRSIQNVFFKYINDLIGGYKELSMNQSKRDHFRADMKESCHSYKSKRIQGGLKFANVFIIGELLFTLVIGAVTFLFPILFLEVESQSLKSYVFVFLYMTGPIHSILNSIPHAVQMKISWKRIQGFVKHLTDFEVDHEKTKSTPHCKDELTIELKGVEYAYHNEHGESFSVGPLDCQFQLGEIVFVTGGNGSGKSTLAKLITGLYSCGKGEILINNQKIRPDELGELYSVIFSDYYLFHKIYGVDCDAKAEEIEQYLKILRIDQKLQIENGEFSTTKLSTGQRKRLALLISYLEDKPIYLFDEWAADQDPEYREFFYMNLLPRFKEKGKCVIAITHDDRYFHLADRVIKMERGKIIEEKQANMIS